MKKFFLISTIIVLTLAAAGVCAVVFLGEPLFERYIDSWAKRLVDLEKRGLLSKKMGAGWHDVTADAEMKKIIRSLIDKKEDDSFRRDEEKVIDGIILEDYPSLGIVEKLNALTTYSNTIRIEDRKNRPIAVIRTDHQRAKISEFPPVLIKALIAAEDKNFFSNPTGVEYKSVVRSVVRSAIRSLTTFSAPRPSATSTITQQVAKLLISSIDEQGRRRVSRTIDRKLREMRLAAALRKIYSAEEILEIYVNHCVTSDHGLIGYKDIAAGLFNKRLDELTDAECIYLSRMVKWGRNIKTKIVAQCRIDMPRIAEALRWDKAKQQQVLDQIDALTFYKPKRIETEYDALVDCANEFWLATLAKMGATPPQLAQMDISDPDALVRRKGNVVIQLCIDKGLQDELQRLVKARGFGPDTVIVTDVRIGSFGENITSPYPPKDTIGLVSILDTTQIFTEMNSNYQTVLKKGDTLYTNIRYTNIAKNKYRRSCFYYVMRPMKVPGQYFAYVIIDSKTGKMLAYYSRDGIGSRLTSLLKNSTPNGSAVAKPILHAINFDLGTFKPYEKWNDLEEVTEDVPWKRTFVYQKGKPIGVVFALSSVRGKGYEVSNHDNIFEGCQYVFEHLNTSNNILGVEMAYRLNRTLFTPSWEVNKKEFGLAQFFYRLNSLNRLKEQLRLQSVTGIRVYKELARIVGVDIDSMVSYGKKIPISDSMFSVALGSLELTLYEQVHLFNVLYNNDLISNPADHPSLVIENIVVNEDTIYFKDVITRYHPFADINNLRPVYLGLHKRLISNPADRLANYDIPYTLSEESDGKSQEKFSEDMFWLDEPVSNFAKSGTTDDVIKPFNEPGTTKKRTNYGLWNAVIRIDLAKLSNETTPDVRDITIACIGECNYHYTGQRDGKTLHKFLSTGLLRKAGIESPKGYFAKYEEYLIRVTPEYMHECREKPNIVEAAWNSIKSIFSKDDSKKNNPNDNIHADLEE